MDYMCRNLARQNVAYIQNASDDMCEENAYIKKLPLSTLM